MGLYKFGVFEQKQQMAASDILPYIRTLGLVGSMVSIRWTIVHGPLGQSLCSRG